MQTNSNFYRYTHVHTRLHTYTHVYTHTRIHTHTHTHSLTHSLARSLTHICTKPTQDYSLLRFFFFLFSDIRVSNSSVPYPLHSGSMHRSISTISLLKKMHHRSSLRWPSTERIFSSQFSKFFNTHFRLHTDGLSRFFHNNTTTTTTPQQHTIIYTH